MKPEATIAAYTGERKDVTGMIKRPPKRALDVGCSNGVLGASLKRIYPDCYVAGIEYDPDFALAARGHLDEVFVADLDNLDPDALPQDFDLIIFADVLEHTKEPSVVLGKILKNARADAEIIISVPNVQHWTAIANLLTGEWPERDRGLFDRTHLRFFTLKSIRSLAASCSCGISEVRRNYRISDSPKARRGRMLRLIPYLPIKAFFTYQYVVRLTRSAS